MGWRGFSSAIFSTREEVPPILLFCEEKMEGDWVSQSSRPVGGWQEEWAHPTRILLVIRARGEVVKTGKEEPGGVGGEEEGGDEREGERDAPEGIFF